MKISMLVALLMAFSACSSKPKVKDFPKSANADEEISILESDLQNAKENEYSVYAPDSYTEAKHALQNAKTMEKKNERDSKVLKEVALGQAWLDRAEKNTQKNKSKLEEVNLARDAAIAANAKTLLPADLAKMDDKVKEETAKLENGKENKLKEKRAELITGYQDLELKAIKKYHLGESQFLINDAVNKGARKLTPKTLSSTKQKYKEAETFISKNRHDTAEIETISAALLAEARNLEATTNTARGLKGSTPEETAIRMRAEEDRLNKTEAALTEEQDTSAALAASNSQLSEEQKLNAVYEEARTKFSSDEAEVYKQGKNLVIRLRALEFPKAQATLKGENFALLKKVEEVIQSFDRSKVIVEGHTDSTGTKSVNEKLSQERADAVKQYLEANSGDMVSEFESEGYGYEKPLASNKTPHGRAQNRRVDVIIAPSEI